MTFHNSWRPLRAHHSDPGVLGQCSFQQNMYSLSVYESEDHNSESAKNGASEAPRQVAES